MSDVGGVRIEKSLHEFLVKHKDAAEIICNKAGEPLAALYFSEIGRAQQEFKNILRNTYSQVSYLDDPKKETL